MNHVLLIRYVVVALALLLVVPVSGLAQSSPSAGVNSNGSNINKDNDENPVTLHGGVNFFGELYSIDGRERRRPASTARLSLTPTVTLYNTLKFNFNFLVSTENATGRQELNQGGVHPKWSWGEAQAGDFTESYTPLTLNGVKIRGASIALFPKAVTFKAVGGVTNRAVATTDNNRSFERRIYGASLGFGSRTGTHVTFIALNARDQLASLNDPPPPPIGDSAVVNDTTTDTTLNPQAVTPQENLVLATVFNVSALGGKVTWKGELAGSANTRDRRSPALDANEVPDAVNNLLTPTVSTSFDYSYITDVQLRASKQVTLNAGYSYLGPGYVSLAVASLPVDYRQVRFGANYRSRATQVRFNAALQEDNLIDQKRFTTKRNRFTLALVNRPTSRWNITTSVGLVRLDNNSTDSLASVDNNNWIIRNAHTISFRRGIIRSFGIDYTYQTAKEANLLRKQSEFDSHTATIRLAFDLGQSLSLSPNINTVISRRGAGGWRTTKTFGASARHRALQNRLANSASVNISNDSQNTSLRLNLRSSYPVKNIGNLTIGLSHTRFTSDNPTAKEFNETSGNLTLSRSF